MRNVATRFTVGKAGRGRMMSGLRATLVLTATFPASGGPAPTIHSKATEVTE